MKSSEYYWQNFELGKELEIAGGFIYDGLRNLHEMETVRYESEIFSVLYSLSVGLERFLKVTVVLLEFDENTDSTEFEKRLMTHNHSVLVDRIKKSHNLQFDKAHNELLSVLTKFYKSYRYDRYSIRSVNDLSKEKKAFLKYLKKYLDIDITENPLLEVVINERCIREFVGKTVGKIVSDLYKVISDAARSKNIYTCEVRYFSKAYKLLYGNEYDFEVEDTVWKELLVFLVNTNQKSDWLDYIKSIKPLELDAALIDEYLQSFGSNVKKIDVSEEILSLYGDVEKKDERIKMLSILGKNDVDLEWITHNRSD